MLLAEPSHTTHLVQIQETSPKRIDRPTLNIIHVGFVFNEEVDDVPTSGTTCCYECCAIFAASDTVSGDVSTEGRQAHLEYPRQLRFQGVVGQYSDVLEQMLLAMPCHTLRLVQFRGCFQKEYRDSP
jgi:hypothetical protein